MPTAMSEALTKAGLITQEQSDSVRSTPAHMEHCFDLIPESDRLVALLEEHKVPWNIHTLGVIAACSAMRERGEYRQALQHMISHMKSMAVEHGIPV
ncbi:hypothetical protein H6786_00470 [Candidatus Nomurabacteria bacterium]|nr:hypothetical protein [Candidatus Nomurabacteria bacterium]